jgi:hypothetical protein
LSDRLATLSAGQPTMVYCASWYRSAIAARLMRRSNIAQAIDLVGGLPAWDVGAPAHRERAVTAIELEPVDGIQLTILVENATDPLLVTAGRRSRGSVSHRRETRGLVRRSVDHTTVKRQPREGRQDWPFRR